MKITLPDQSLEYQGVLGIVPPAGPFEIVPALLFESQPLPETRFAWIHTTTGQSSLDR